MKGLTLRQQLERRLGALKKERYSWEPAWKDITKQMAPNRARFTDTKKNKGDIEDTEIYNNKPIQALRTLAAGLMAGVTSPARKWHNLKTTDKDLNEQHDVKVWLDQVQREIEKLFQTSNFYPVLSNGVYPDLGSVGSPAMLSEEHEPGTLNYTALPIGRFWLDRDHKGKPDTMFREVMMSVRELRQKFGEENLSVKVKRDIGEKRYENLYKVYQAILPNDEYSNAKIGREGMRWASYWWEATNPDKHQMLRQGGFHEFPVHAPRWTYTDGDAYGRAPGWDCRGDCKGLQHYEEKMLMILDKIVDPPMTSSDNIKRGTLLPGDNTIVPKGQESIYEPSMAIDPRALEIARAQVKELEQRIDDTMYVFLFNRLMNDNRAQRATATEIEAIRQEVMLLLGPLLENLDTGLLEPAVDRAFNVLERAGKLPEPPESLVEAGEFSGVSVSVEFISVLHSVQQATGLNSIRALLTELAGIAELQGDVLDKVDFDKVVDEIANIMGVRPDLLVAQEQVDEARSARAQQEQAQQQQEQQLAGSQAIKNVSGADPQQISQIAQQFSPAAAAQGGALGPATDQ